MVSLPQRLTYRRAVSLLLTVDAMFLKTMEINMDAIDVVYKNIAVITIL